MIELKFLFDTIEEAQEFLSKKSTKKPKEKKENDRRGRSTKLLHEQCKLYQQSHPEKLYRECLKELKTLRQLDKIK